MIKLLDFLLAERGLYDYSLTEISENSGIAWTTLNRIFPRFIDLGIVKETRRIGRAKLYAIDEKHPLVKKLVSLRTNIADYFIEIELKKQERKAVAIRV